MGFRANRKKDEKVQQSAAQPVVQTKLSVGKVDDPLEHQADSVADQVMQMAEPATVQRKCQHCEEEEVHRKEISPFIQRQAGEGGTQTSQAVSNQIESTKGGGESLSGETKSFMETRFNADFSNVRIHQGPAAAELSGELSAQAFTVGNDIYFNTGKYSPETSAGKHLLAHELTHTLQQAKGIQPKLIQRACEDAPEITMAACAEGATDVAMQAQGVANAVDARALAIIATAAGTGSNQDKAMQVVHDIICAYVPSKAGGVRKIKYKSDLRGLGTTRVGTGPTAQGDICVGDDFLTHTTNAGISRRVLQVVHELDHIAQYRGGMIGETNQDEREFLAFHNEGLADEFVGTGRMSHATRKALIDAAIGYYFCLSATLQTTHASKLANLQARRLTVNGTNGNPSTPEPTACRRQG